MLRRFGEDVAVVADEGHERHDQLLADGVNRRVRHLREELVEIIEERARLFRAAGERGVVAHRADGFLAVTRHGLQDELQILVRVAKESLSPREVGRDFRGDDLREESLDDDVVLLDPAAVGAATRIECLHFGVLQDAAVREVEFDHRPRTQPPVPHDRRGVDVENARLRGEDEQPRFRQRPPRGAEAVAVERRPRRHAVRERDGRGPVPRLHQRGVVFAEAAHVVAHVILRPPRLRHEHEHRVRRIAPGGDEQLEHVVERGGVGLAVGDEWQRVGKRVAEERRGEVALARLERVEISFERVDLAVVREHPKGVREFPRGEGVR